MQRATAIQINGEGQLSMGDTHSDDDWKLHERYREELNLQRESIKEPDIFSTVGGKGSVYTALQQSPYMHVTGKCNACIANKDR